MRLNNGERFPELGVDLVGGDTLDLPGDIDSGWGVILFFRGHW
jgi:hypothetical protein